MVATKKKLKSVLKEFKFDDIDLTFINVINHLPKLLSIKKVEQLIQHNLERFGVQVDLHGGWTYDAEDNIIFKFVLNINRAGVNQCYKWNRPMNFFMLKLRLNLLYIIINRRILKCLELDAEDEEDLAVFAQHNPEESIPFEEIVASLKRDGKLQ